MARIKARHIDLYEPRTRQEQGYIFGILLVYKENSIKDVAMYAAIAIRLCINTIKVFIQDAEFELND